MAGVQRLKKIEGFPAPHLANGRLAGAFRNVRQPRIADDLRRSPTGASQKAAKRPQA
jgi:hypothetical protein